MSLSNQEILDAISNMSVLDLSELVKAMEEKFGVSAAAPAVAMPMAAAGGAEDASEVAEEQTEFELVLKEFGDKKVGVIKAVRGITGLGLVESKKLVESAPCTVKDGLSKEEADQMKEEIESAGGTVEIK